MEPQTMNMRKAIEMRTKGGRAVVAFGLWLRAGIIGASGLVGGLIQLLGGEAKPLSALALAVGGGVLAAVSWRRVRAALDTAGGEAAASAAAPSRATPTLRTAREGAH